MRSIKAYSVPGDAIAAAALWRTTGFDWVMLAPSCLDSPGTAGLLSAIRGEGLRWSAIEPVFLADEGTVAHAGTVAHGASGESELSIGESGLPLIAEWVRFACPSKVAHARRVEERLRAHAELAPDGMSLDFARFWQFWERVPENAKGDSLRSGCFCPDCRADRASRGFGGAGAPGGNLAAAADSSAEADISAWRRDVVERRIAALSSLARGLLPGVVLGLHTVPWGAEEYGGAITRVLGQDIAALAPFVDYLTPMAYHHMVGRDPEWIGRVAADQAARSGLPVVPCAQTAPAYAGRELPAGEFIAAAEAALRAGGGSMALYRHEDLAASPEKAAALRELFAARPEEERS